MGSPVDARSAPDASANGKATLTTSRRSFIAAARALRSVKHNPNATQPGFQPAAETLAYPIVSIPLNADVSIPLVVDLDHTLIHSDTLHEGFAKLLFSNPAGAAAALLSIWQGRAAFKGKIAEQRVLDVSSLPFRTSLLDLLRREKARGRSIHLITAADQRTADAVAAYLSLFDSVVGSDGKSNLKGLRKLDYLRRKFPAGFIYAGDHAADLPLFKAARGAILCDVSRHVANSARASTTILADLKEPRHLLKVWLRALRVHQWAKNLLIFVPLIVGHAYGDPANILAAIAGFVLMCLLASATYMINDIADLDADRLHHSKRRRPFASGDLPIAFGLIAAPLLILGAMIGAYLLSPAFAVTLLLYLGLTLAYSFGLKELPLLDVFVIGVLFTLRIVMGTEVLAIKFSPWLLSFSWAFFLSLALAKRHVEVAHAGHVDVEDVAGRGYRGEDWPLTLGFGIGSGLLSIVIMLLYLTNDAMPSGFYYDAKWLYAVPALIMMWLMRIWLLSSRMELDDDPVVFALRDPASLALGGGAALAFILAL
jgi:4-hydroxybenzoate polyprenyltransferase